MENLMKTDCNGLLVKIPLQSLIEVASIAMHLSRHEVERRLSEAQQAPQIACTRDMVTVQSNAEYLLKAATSHCKATEVFAKLSVIKPENRTLTVLV